MLDIIQKVPPRMDRIATIRSLFSVIRFSGNLIRFQIYGYFRIILHSRPIAFIRF
jgi:hypothetical protein